MEEFIGEHDHGFLAPRDVHTAATSAIILSVGKGSGRIALVNPLVSTNPPVRGEVSQAFQNRPGLMRDLFEPFQP